MTTWPHRAKVEAAFGADPAGDPVDWTWVDLSDRLTAQPIAIKRGKSSDAGAVQPMRVALELNNEDGALTPRHPLSPWYPDVRKGTPFRVSVWHDGAWHVRMAGEAGSWAPTWPEGAYRDGTRNYARVRVEVAGIIRRLRQGDKPLYSALRRLATSPINTFTAGSRVVAYWPLEDGRASGWHTSASARAQPLFPGGDWSYASDSTLAGSDALPTVSGGRPAGWSARLPLAGNLTTWAVDFFVRLPTPETTPTFTPLMVIRTNGTPVDGWVISVTNDAYRVTSLVNGTQFGVSAISLDPSFFDGWTLVRMASVQNGGNVDWSIAWVSLGTGVAHGISDSYAGDAGEVTALQNLFVAPPDGISFGHFLVSDGLPLGWLAPADTGWVGERASSRISRLCIEEGVPVTVLGNAADTERMGAQRVDTLMSLVGEAAAADGGILAEARDTPGLLYIPRAELFNQAAALTVDAEADDGFVAPFEPVEDDQAVRNDVTVERVDGATARVADVGHIEAEGRFDESVAFNLEADQHLGRHAGWRLALGTWPEMRYPTLTVDLSLAPEMVPAWLAVDLGSRVVIANLPAEHPPGPVDQLVDGYTETIAPERWQAEINGSPAGPWLPGALDDGAAPDPTARRLDTDGSELAAGIGVDDTSLSVTVTSGPLWTTDAAHVPFDVTIGGERMTVTAIAGTGSPQAFTVARSVNGVVKTHPAGVAVQVFDPLRLAL